MGTDGAIGIVGGGAKFCRAGSLGVGAKLPSLRGSSFGCQVFAEKGVAGGGDALQALAFGHTFGTGGGWGQDVLTLFRRGRRWRGNLRPLRRRWGRIWWQLRIMPGNRKVRLNAVASGESNRLVFADAVAAA